MNAQTFYLIPIQQPKTSHSPDKKTFNRLIAKLKSLKAQEVKMVQELDIALHFYYEKIHPDENILQKAIADLIKILHQYYKTPKSFTQQELVELKAMISCDIEIFCQINRGFDNIPSEIKEIFNEINEISFDEKANQELASMKNEAFELFEEMGIDPDSVGIESDDSLDMIMRKMFASFQGKNENLKHANNKQTKTKKQCEIEAKQKKLEEIKQKGLGDIYKKLARILHPDLEQNGSVQIAKEELMMKLTDAYKRKDLYDILNIEAEATKCTIKHLQEQTNEKKIEQFDTYNTILKDQIKTLESILKAYVPLSFPKYAPIQRFIDNPSLNFVTSLKLQYKLLHDDIDAVQDLVIRLNTPEGRGIIKETIKERRKVRKQGVIPF